jgi:hypothetical protein
MVGDNMANNGEAQAGASSATTTGTIDTVKTLEDAIQTGHWDANTLISNLHLNRPINRHQGHRHEIVFIAVLHRIVNKVADSGDQLEVISVNQ